MNVKTSTAIVILCLSTFLPSFSENLSGVEFSSEESGNKTTTTCMRDGQIIYKYILVDGDQKYFAYIFYWNREEAATILRTSDEDLAIHQAAELPVSYSFTLDKSQHPYAVSISDTEGRIIDGLLREDGRLVPLTASELTEPE